MKQFIIPEGGNFYKANLHCHSTCSDGRLTPEELKELYRSNGYSVLAYSDHNVLVDHSELSDESFLALTACEYDINKMLDKPFAYRPCYHINFFSPDPHMTSLPCFNYDQISDRHADLKAAQKFIGEPNFKRDYKKVNDMIAEFAKHGFLVMLNHPTWSLQAVEDYDGLDNIFAMEMYNNGCYVEGFEEINTHIFDYLLKSGKHVFCTATDDNHNAADIDDPHWDSLGGFVMIKAERLDYPTIFNALKNGDFYASTGPEIKELYIEDGCLHVKTSPATRITLTTAARQARVAYPESGEQTLTEAVFSLERIWPGYIRISVDDGHGHHAWSQPIWGEFSGRTN